LYFLELQIMGDFVRFLKIFADGTVVAKEILDF